MCIAIPGEIVEIVDAAQQIGRAEVAGQVRTIQLALLEPEEVRVGAWVLVHANLALRTLDAAEAASLLHLLNELEQRYEEKI